MVKKLSRIVDEFNQWREPENKPYFNHYLLNAVKIVFGCEPTDYRSISHGNNVIGSFIYGIDDSREYISPGNKISGGAQLDFTPKDRKR